jgi:hypothetical protein
VLVAVSGQYLVDPKTVKSARDIKQDSSVTRRSAGLNSRSALERAACGLCSYSVASQRKTLGDLGDLSASSSDVATT